MAQRLATNYANANFTVNEQELDQFVMLFVNEMIDVKVKVTDSGDRDIVIENQNGDIELFFRRSGNRYSCVSSYVIQDLALANAMRKAMKTFRGNGIVHRIYEGFTMVYHYDDGAVVRIVELSDKGAEPIYESAAAQKQVQQLETLFHRNDAEQEIAWVREQTDRLLDLRNWLKTAAPERLAVVDEQLTALSHRLFVLEV